MLRGRMSLLLVAVAVCGCASMDSDFGAAPSGSGPTDEQVAQWQAAAKKGQEKSKKAQAEQDKALCLEFGYKPGTEVYANCRENLHQKRQEAEQAALARNAAARQAEAANQAAIAGAIIAKGPPQYKPITVQPLPKIEPYQIPPPPRQITTECRRDPVIFGNVTCTSR